MISPYQTLSAWDKRSGFKSSLRYRCLGVPCCTQIIPKSIWHGLAAPEFWIFAVWVTDHFWILERLAFAPSGGPAQTSEGCFSETRPPSQLPSLPKFNFGTASPTRCTNYSVLPESRFCHTFCRLGFMLHFSWHFELRNGDAMLTYELNLIHMNYIWFIYEDPFSSLCYICYIWFAYGLHMSYIQFTYESWIVWFLHMLHVIYIQFTCENWVPHILKKINKASWFSETIFESRYFIANWRTGLELAEQGGSKPPRKLDDAFNAATNLEAARTNPQYRLPQ